MSSTPSRTDAEPIALDASPAAATWQERAAAELWCPPELLSHLGDGLAWVAAATYADADARAVDAGAGWRLVAATRRGRVHAHAGAHREDAYALASAGGVALIVVSDGAGSSRWSRVGAEVTCRETVRGAVAALAGAQALDAAALGAALASGVRAACDVLRALAERAAVPARDFRCTALAVAVDPAAGALAAVQVGDGVIALRTTDGTVRVVGSGEAGEFSGEVSCFVPDACADARAAAVHLTALADVADVLVATDGIEDPFYPLGRTGPALFAQLYDGVTAPLDGFHRQPAHGPVLGPGVPPADAAERLAAWLGFEKRGENDDRTAVVLARVVPLAGGA